MICFYRDLLLYIKLAAVVGKFELRKRLNLLENPIDGGIVGLKGQSGVLGIGR